MLPSILVFTFGFLIETATWHQHCVAWLLLALFVQLIVGCCRNKIAANISTAFLVIIDDISIGCDSTQNCYKASYYKQAKDFCLLCATKWLHVRR